MRRYPSREAYSNLVEGIRITPLPLQRSAKHPDDVKAVTFSPDGNYMATLSKGMLWLHKTDAIATGGELGESHSLTSADETIASFAFSPDGTYLAAASKGRVRLWLTKTMKELAPITGSDAALFDGGKNLIAVLDENRDAEFDHARGNVVRIWRPEGEGVREVTNAKVPGNVSGITFIADSPFFATLINEDDTPPRFDFWQTSDGQSAAGSVRPVAGSHLSPNAKYFWSKVEETITLSNTQTGKRVLDRLRVVNFSPDGRFLVTTS